MSEATSPAASGPAGGHFEGQVGASYLLSMLVGAEPRGLPGTIIDRVEFQRAGEGYFLDDVIVHAHDPSGNAATLEVQVKRDVKFSPKDEVFQKVVGQIAKSSATTDFWNRRQELGIAISRSSHKIDGAYQDVLTWARQLGDARTFFERMARPGSANDDMRDFVATFKSHLGAAGGANDDETVWKLLRRLQIFVVDFTATGSASEQLAKERAVRALHPEDGLRATDFWKSLTELALDIAKSGGDRTRDQLIADVRERSFRLAGDRQKFSARQALAEGSRNTLEDIGDSVGGVMLTRHKRVTAVHAALDTGRYVEIRGNAGVGKSGVLKHFARQISAEASVIAFSPARTLPKGWLALRAALGFDGTARDLLSDLAGSGSALLFVDGLDFFGAEERLTVVDLVREAATIPGVSVIVTARRDFGVAEPNWLPADALDRLGRAKPVVIEELSDEEADELRSATPQLTALLSDNHPAKGVAHNLFRLSRLANRPSAAPTLRTEAEMAEEWWQSADGAKDAIYRDRARVLKSLAEQALARADHLTVAGLPAPAVDALIASETLRDLGNDRVAFRHDVLREWAIANLLYSDPSLLAQLALDCPAPADLGRGVELTARLAIERTADVEKWRSLHASVTANGVNESWGRAVLLALVRSEIGLELLDKVSADLFADRAKLLRELIRIAVAVESEPADKYYTAMGVDPGKIPAGISVPVGPSWLRLIFWLLRTGTGVPAAAIPDVVSLYSGWSIVAGGRDPLSPRIAEWFYYWLREIEAPAQNVSDQARPRPFNGELTSGQIGKLAEELRTGFLLLCNHAPRLAAEYLNNLSQHPYRDHALRELMKFRGMLAQAAPKELAELTADYLIPEEDDADEEYGGPFPEAFKYLDLDFVPASPAQGPFYDLLLHGPEYGVPLIRRIVDHAIAFKSGGRDFGNNVMTVVFPDGSEKAFPWYQSYGWSRDMGAGPSVVASALMALEAWSHGRIEKGEPVDKVVADVIGESPAPAAYLLVAVDLLLSHWPSSHTAAVPFVACPELLCLDRQRVVGDNMRMPDIFGLKEIQREPSGLVSLESLKARPSRQLTLNQLLDLYAREEYGPDRPAVHVLLERAKNRLGPPQQQSDLGDPEFMILHALNRIDPANWRKATVHTSDGTEEVWEYVSPAAESDHLKPLQDATQERHSNSRMEASIRIAMNNPERSSPTFAAAAVKWAQTVVDKPASNETEQWMHAEAAVTAALIAARDGGAELIAEHEGWIREAFKRAFEGKEDPVHRMRAGLQYNPIAIAFLGTSLLLRNRFDLGDVRTLLDAAGNDNPAAAQGFAASLLAETDERLPRTLLRCAFFACIQPARRWGLSEEDYKAQMEAHRGNVRNAIDAEIAWLEGKQAEPSWPAFEPSKTHSRHHRSFSARPATVEENEPRPEKYTDHQAAALWLGKVEGIFDVAKRPWLRDVIKAYSVWTAVANGAELQEDDDPDRTPHEWNYAFFNLLARCLPGLTLPQIDELALGLVLKLPGEAFMDVMTVFVRSVDDVYFSGTSLGDAEAVHIRTTLAHRLMTSRQWQWQLHELSDRITTHLGPAIAGLVFNNYGPLGVPAKCYLLPKGIDRLGPFLPLLRLLGESGPFLFLVMTLLNLLEVSPMPAHLDLICAVVKNWLTAHPGSREFWIGYEVGRRVCALLTAILAQAPRSFAPDKPARRDVDDFLGKLIRLGVAEAHQLEEIIRQVQ